MESKTETTDVKECLMRQARYEGICKDGYEHMRSCDIDKLIDYYIQNPDWCLERDYPTLDYLKEHFADAHNKGVYISKTFNGELLNDKLVCILHDCKGVIKVGLNAQKAIIPMLYIANNCHIRILGVGQKGTGQCRVPVYIFGKNDVSAHDNEHVKFVKFKSDLIV